MYNDNYAADEVFNRGFEQGLTARAVTELPRYIDPIEFDVIVSADEFKAFKALKLENETLRAELLSLREQLKNA